MPWLHWCLVRLLPKLAGSSAAQHDHGEIVIQHLLVFACV